LPERAALDETRCAALLERHLDRVEVLRDHGVGEDALGLTAHVAAEVPAGDVRQREQADARAKELTEKGKGVHFVQRSKEPMSDDAPGIGAVIPRPVVEAKAVVAKEAVAIEDEEEIEDDDDSDAEREEDDDEE